MKKRLFVSALAIALPLALAGFFILHPMRARSEDQSPPAQVQVDNFSFTPDTLTVKANQAVIWVNKDDVPHTVTSTDGSFKSKALDTDDKYSYTFRKAGTYSYYCSMHPKMVGTIVVQ